MSEMRPSDVPAEYVETGADAIHAHYAANPDDESEENAIRILLAAVLPLHAQRLRAELEQQREEWGQKYNGGGYLTRVDSDWMRERWPVEQWAWDNTRHGGVVGKRTIIVVEDWQEMRSADLPAERPGNEQAVPGGD